MTRTLLLIGLAAILATACDGTAVPTGIDPHDGPLPSSVTRIPIEETVLVESECLSEPIELRLRQQLVTGGPFDANGGVHTHLVVNDRGTTGTGLMTGARYRQTGAETSTDNVLGPPPLILTAHNTLNLVGQGSAPDVRLRQLLHVTMNANGEVTAFTSEMSVVCH